MKSFELPEHLHPLADYFGFPHQIKTEQIVSSVYVGEDEKPKLGSMYKGCKVVKEAYNCEDMDYEIQVIKYSAHIKDNFTVALVVAPTKEEAVRRVPEAFIKWVKDGKEKTVREIQNLKKNIESLENHMKGLRELGIS